MSIAITDLPMGQIRRLCHEAGVSELSIFGSALRDDFRSDSDIDLLVTFDGDDYGPWMSRLTNLQESLADLLGRPVDLVPRDNLKWAIRDEVLSRAKVIYAK